MIDHIFFDAVVEEDRITELAAIRTNRKGDLVLASYSDPIKKDDETNVLGVSLDVAMKSLKEIILSKKFDSTYIVVGFSHPKVEAERFRKVLDGGWLYLSHLAWPMVSAQLIPSLSLESIAKSHGVFNAASGTAAGNVSCIANTYWRMMRRYKTALAAEEAARKLGGNTLESIRDFIGI